MTALNEEKGPLVSDQFRIESFWKPRFSTVQKPTNEMKLKGWALIHETNPRFVEPDLILRSGFENIESPVWLIAAPGAVGKSTFARQLAASTGSVFLDLAIATSVAGNYLSGGLAKNGLSGAWSSNQTAVLIDALDEARLRVTPGSFEDFLADVSANAVGRSVPVVLFGRTGIIEDAWATLTDSGLDCPIFDVQFFNEAQSLEFVIQSLEGASASAQRKGFAGRFTSHRANYIDAAERFLDELRAAATLDGDRFAGYAPVLQAVASVLAEETNPSKLDSVILLAKQTTVLRELSEQILIRESGKIHDALKDDIDAQTLTQLYSPKEQKDRLAARILGYEPPAIPITLSPAQTTAYEAAVTSFFDVHPFLDGTGKEPSGAVFSAAITANALRVPQYEPKARIFANGGTHTPNPFLINFLLEAKVAEPKEVTFISPEHVALLYESLRAAAKSGDIIRLQIEAGEDEEADGELSVSNEDRSLEYYFVTSQAGTVSFARSVSGISIQAPLMDVTIGIGESFDLIAPVFLNISKLTVNASELIVGKEHPLRGDDFAVVLEASTLENVKLQSTPTVRAGVEFLVSWPGSVEYPWSKFSSSDSNSDGSELANGLRRLRRLVLAFRSHSKGRLARIQAKIEHARMTKGEFGDRLREALLTDHVLSLEGKMYYLDAKALGSVVGTSFLDVKMKRYSKQTLSYIQKLL